ncbi:L-serine ammonia-lyase [Pseudomonadota bacterium]
MFISIFKIFKKGIGPSSSHTMGPMNAAKQFIYFLKEKGQLKQIERINVDLYGSIALTRNGHGTVLAIELGLEGYSPDSIDSSKIEMYEKTIQKNEAINLLQEKRIHFTRKENFNCRHNELLSYHNNGMTFTAYNQNGDILYKNSYYSIGGGFIVSEDDIKSKKTSKVKDLEKTIPFYYKNMTELLAFCDSEKKQIWEIVLENEKTFLTEKEIDLKIRELIHLIKNSVSNGINNKKETLKSGLHLKRRANKLFQKLKNIDENKDPLAIIDWITMCGIAVGEENASYSTIVTTPTNGASGVIPATIEYYDKFIKKDDFKALKKFILTAGAIGILCKINASISGAECGCQAEIGTACSMAAAGLTAALGGTNLQIENAAIIGLSHNLGLTCDPVGGFVQIPCIERNGIIAVKAVASARLAMLEEKSGYLKLDEVIEAMKETGKDMNNKYKETSLGGLALTAAQDKHCNNINNTCKGCTIKSTN